MPPVSSLSMIMPNPSYFWSLELFVNVTEQNLVGRMTMENFVLHITKHS